MEGSLLLNQYFLLAIGVATAVILISFFSLITIKELHLFGSDISSRLNKMAESVGKYSEEKNQQIYTNVKPDNNSDIGEDVFYDTINQEMLIKNHSHNDFKESGDMHSLYKTENVNAFSEKDKSSQANLNQSVDYLGDRNICKNVNESMFIDAPNDMGNRNDTNFNNKTTNENYIHRGYSQGFYNSTQNDVFETNMNINKLKLANKTEKLNKKARGCKSISKWIICLSTILKGNKSDDEKPLECIKVGPSINADKTCSDSDSSCATWAHEIIDLGVNYVKLDKMNIRRREKMDTGQKTVMNRRKDTTHFRKSNEMTSSVNFIINKDVSSREYDNNLKYLTTSPPINYSKCGNNAPSIEKGQPERVKTAYLVKTTGQNLNKINHIDFYDKNSIMNNPMNDDNSLKFENVNCDIVKQNFKDVKSEIKCVSKETMIGKINEIHELLVSMPSKNTLNHRDFVFRNGIFQKNLENLVDVLKKTDPEKNKLDEVCKKCQRFIEKYEQIKQKDWLLDRGNMSMAAFNELYRCLLVFFYL